MEANHANARAQWTNRSDWITGMILGGGSSVNGLYYGRGSNAVYSRWEEVSGSGNWSLDNILATFNALENYQGLTITPGARGENGPVNVLQTPTVSQLTATYYCPQHRQRFLEFQRWWTIMIRVLRIA